MNEALKNMAEEAGISLVGVDEDIGWHTALEAFARLIAEDCADVAESGVFCRECGGSASARAIRQKYGA